MTYPLKNISISINRPADEVYRYASNPRNFPQWVGFIQSMTPRTDKVWVGKTDLGEILIQFNSNNRFGILDHLVKLPDGSTVNNPMRVIENGTGSELIFTLFWMPNRSEEEFSIDAQMVKKDLFKIKSLLESQEISKD